MLENTAKDFGNFIVQDLDAKLEPINKSVDDMFVRLEEFQTLVSITKQNVDDSTEMMKFVQACAPRLDELFKRIDAAEETVNNIKSNLDKLEQEMPKTEAKTGVAMVSNILNPLFKKRSDEAS